MRPPHPRATSQRSDGNPPPPARIARNNGHSALRRNFRNASTAAAPFFSGAASFCQDNDSALRQQHRPKLTASRRTRREIIRRSETSPFRVAARSGDSRAVKGPGGPKQPASPRPETTWAGPQRLASMIALFVAGRGEAGSFAKINRETRSTPRDRPFRSPKEKPYPRKSKGRSSVRCQ